MANVQARSVLWYLVFMGFAINYMMRINLNITIVEMVVNKGSKAAMVDPHATATTFTSSSAPLPQQPDRLTAQTAGTLGAPATDVGSTVAALTADIKAGAAAQRNISGEIEEFQRHHIARIYQLNGNCSGSAATAAEEHHHGCNTTSEHIDSDEPQRFDWNEYQQGLVLGSFFWAHWLTQIPGGILAKKYGTKLVFGLSNAIGCWMCFFIPAASYWDYRALIWLRVVQGLITGLAWPAMHVMTAKWIPPNERSKFVTAYLGSSVGIAAFYPLFGYVMHWSSWQWVYYICGIVGTLWWLGWQVLVFDSPAQHPRISETELRYIEKSLGASVHTTPAKGTPWKDIITSRPVWMNVIAQFGGIWGLFTLMTQAPTYFRVIHNWNIRATGLLSGFPHLMRMLFAYVFSLFADYLLKSEKMSRTNVRKVATAACCLLKGLLVLGLAYFGHNSTAAIVFLTLATMVHGAVSSGPLASIVDIAPNFAGIVLGISGMIGVLPGFISPYIIGILTLGNQTFESWKNVFLISAAMLIASGILYIFFAESTLQDWNSYNTHKDDKELQLVLEKDSKPSELTILHPKEVAALASDGDDHGNDQDSKDQDNKAAS